ncbi:AraC family transcriptional regulator [Actinocorallia populi]|uniref:AraC family transcriptional regulator n=1 Tax=Actinocorallia populi TaxID=2079200 RepID=UPI000D0943D6|nr:AraC family transcriptional regulator [Actinocorallia populi]
MNAAPISDSSGLVYFTDGSLVYAGRHVHEDSYPAHTHSFVEIAVVAEGGGTHLSQAGRRDLTAGDVVLLRPGVWHEYEECAGLVLHNCCFGPGLLGRELAWAREDPLLGHLLWTGPYALDRRGMLTTRLEGAALQEGLSHLEALAELQAKPVHLHRGDAVGRLALLFGCLARAVAGPGADALAPASPPHPAVAEAMRLMEGRLAHRWTLAELAGELHLVPGSLVRLFKSAVGVPPMTYLARQRAEAAAALLVRSDQPIVQIGQAVGWPDPNHFARRFKAHFGLSASVYRRRFSGAPHISR